MSAPFVVVGAGQAGMQVCDTLRKSGYEGDLILFGDESGLPYQRPPLSKAYLGGELDASRLLFRPADYFAKHNIDIRTAQAVVAIDRSTSTITLDNGDSLAYDKLALTTGTRVRQLNCPGSDLDDIYYVRSLDDSNQLAARLESAASVTIIGGGFIGLEVASQARKLGKQVTVIEAQSRLMERAVSETVSAFYLQLHQRNEVDVRLGTGVKAIERDDGGSLCIRLSDGGEVISDLVVAGIGVVTNSEIAEAAGLECDNGIVVDEFACTSDPAIVSAGDCTMHFNGFLQQRIRLESVQNAVDQAKTAAQSMLGQRTPYVQVPWFWSDQYDVKLQMAGITSDHDEHVVRGDTAAGTFSIFYFRDGKLLGADSVNSPADHMACRRLLSGGKELDPRSAADTTINLMQLAKG